MNPKALIPLVAGLAIGGFALKMGIDTLSKAKGAPAPKTQLWGAIEDIPRGTTIDETMLKAIAFPVDLVPEGAFQKKEDVVGRVPRIAAPAGLPLLESMLLPPGTKPGLWVKPGYRAVAVKVDETAAVSNHILPGAHVDVVAYFRVRQGRKSEMIARTLLEDIEVAAVGQQLSVVQEEEDGSKRAKPARSISLFVKPEQVPILHLAEQQGKLKLSLRGQEDVSSDETQEPIKADQIFGLRQEPEEKESKGGLLASLFSAFKPQEKPETQPEPVVQDVLPEADAQEPETVDPPYAWVMAVCNGSQQQLMAWPTVDSIDGKVLPPSEEVHTGPQPKVPAKAKQTAAMNTRQLAGATARASSQTNRPKHSVPVIPEVEPEEETEPEELTE